MRIVTHKVVGGKVFGDNGGIVVGNLGCKQKIETKSFQVLVLNYMIRFPSACANWPVSGRHLQAEFAYA